MDPKLALHLVRRKLSIRFENILFQLDVPDRSAVYPEFDKLCGRYGEPHRYYHTLRHILYCLSMFDYYNCGVFARKPLSVQLAIFFHDIVYDLDRSDNEEQSAQYFLAFAARMGLKEEFAKRVADLIRSTTHKEKDQVLADDGTILTDCAILLDLDLCSLGEFWEDIQEDNQNLRMEFGEEMYKRKTKAFFESLASRDFIYWAEPIRRMREKRAQENVQLTLERLRG